MMTTLAISRGLPGAGKDTWAAAVQSLDPDGTVVSNRDGLRTLLFGSCGQDYYDCSKDILHRKEKVVTEAQHADIEHALKAGFNVIVSDTNLPVKRCRDLRAIGTKHGAGFQIVDFTHVSLDECLARNRNRTDKDPVPEDVIRSMHDRYVRGGLAPVPDEGDEAFVMVPETGEDREGGQTAYIFDIDGTLAHIPEGGRSPYDYSRVMEDVLDESVAEVLTALDNSGAWVFLVSGRESVCREQTEKWLDDNDVWYDELFMRAEGDDRADWKVKYEIFDKHIRPKYRVLGVFDDRVQVLKMWEEIGLKTFRVGGLNGGNF